MATLSASAPSVPAARADRRGVLSSVIVPVATAIALGALALLVLLTPWSVHVALASGGSAAALGAPDEVLYRLSDETVHDLVLGGDFAVVAPDGSTIYTPAEVAHLENARVALYAFLALAVVMAGAVALAARIPNQRGRW